MAPKIDPESIHLGGNNPQFYAEYLPTDPLSLPPVCSLPAGTDLTLSIPGLTPLEPSCEAIFPEVTPLPPIHNPPAVRFTACEQLFARTVLTTTKSAKNSKFSLTTLGPVGQSDGSPTQCGFVGNLHIDVNACEDFKVTPEIKLSGAIKNSSISFDSSGAPNCGISPKIDLNVEACEDFTINPRVQFSGAAKGSSMVFKSRGIPQCGFDPEILIDVKACEQFQSSVNVNITGREGVVQRNNWSSVATSSPNCSNQVVGDVYIEACPSITAKGDVKVTGSAGKGTISLTAVDDCSLALVGDINVEACGSVAVSSDFKITGGGGASGYLRLDSDSTNKCGIKLQGEINIPKTCESVQTASDVMFIPIPPEDWKNRANPTPLAWLIVESVSECFIQLRGMIELFLPDKTALGFKIDPNHHRLESKSGCDWTGEQDTPALLFTPDPNPDKPGLLSLYGSLPTPCFNCDVEEGPYNFKDITLSNIAAAKVSTCSCCEGSTVIDLCNNTITVGNNGGFYVGNASIETDSVTVGNASIEANSVTVGNASIETDSVTVGSTGGFYVGDVALEQHGLTLGANNSYVVLGENKILLDVTGNVPTFNLGDGGAHIFMEYDGGEQASTISINKTDAASPGNGFYVKASSSDTEMAIGDLSLSTNIDGPVLTHLKQTGNETYSAVQIAYCEDGLVKKGKILLYTEAAAL